ALSRYWSWLPPQPCTRSAPGVPGSITSGAISVPSTLWPLTGIASDSVRRFKASHLFRFHHRVLHQRPGDRIDTLEVHDRAARRPGVRAVQLGRMRTHRAQARVGAECLERRNFRAARTADAPRLLEHAAVPAAARVAPAQHVVIAARGEQPRELRARLVEGERAMDREPHLGLELHAEKRGEAAAHDEEVRTAVGRLPTVVGRRFLRAAVGRPHPVDPDLADAVGRFLLQARLEHHAARGELQVVDAVERLRERAAVRRHCLPFAADAAPMLDAHRPLFEQPLAALQRVGARERGKAGEDNRVHALREGFRPALRPLRVAPRERVRDGLAGDEGMRHHTPEQVVRAANSEASRLLPGKGLARYKIQRRIALQRRLVAAAELEALERGQALRYRHPRGDFVLAQRFIRSVGDYGAHLFTTARAEPERHLLLREGYSNRRTPMAKLTPFALAAIALLGACTTAPQSNSPKIITNVTDLRPGTG